MAHKKIRVHRLDKRVSLPERAHRDDAGIDLASNENATLLPGERRLIRTGLVIYLPRSTEGQIRPRSGLALKYGVTVLNSPGTIDEGYSGELCVLLINLGREAFKVTNGMKIAQLVIAGRVNAVVEEIKEPVGRKRSARGDRGFGSTDDDRGLS